MNVQRLIYNPPKLQIKNSRNPADYFKLMKMYSVERQENFPNISAFIYSVDSMLSGCSLRAVKDESGNLLAAYTYRLRKNKLEQKSLYIDALVRDRSKNTKPLMHRIYSDMKNTAQNKKAEELTCFSVSKDKALRAKYEKLGFRIDPKVDILHAYLMRSPIKNFLNSKWFKNEQYKGFLGLDSILRTHL